MHHDARLAAAPDKAMRLFVILGVAAIIIVLLHAVYDFDIAALKSNTEQAGASLVQPGKQLAFGPDVGAAVGIEWQSVAAADQFVGQLQRARLADDEGIVFQHDRSEEHTSELQSLRHLVCRL